MVNSGQQFKLGTLPGQIPCVAALSAPSAIAANLLIYLLIRWTGSKNQSYLITANQKSVQKMENGTCLVVECMRSCLPVQGDKGPIPGLGRAHGVAGQLSQGSTATSPRAVTPDAHAPRKLCSATREAATTSSMRAAARNQPPLTSTRESQHAATKDSAQPRIKNAKKKGQCSKTYQR